MESKNNKNFGTTYFALAFIVAIFFELYFILTNPYQTVMLLGTGLIVVITGYLTFDSIAKAKAAEAARRDEQSDMLIKASKAIYLATKRSSQEAEQQHVQNIKAIEYMMNKMISNEKEMASLMIAKNEEILAKQITAKPENTTNDMTSLIEQLSASNAKLAKEVQAAITVNELVKANADLVKNVREVLQNSNTLSNTASISDYVKDAVPEIKVAPEPPVASVTPIVPETPIVSEAPAVPETPIVSEAPVFPDATVVPEVSVTPEMTVDSEIPMVEDIPNEQEDISPIDFIDETINVIDELPSELPTEVVEQEPDEFDFESFEIPDETPESVNTNFNNVPLASDEDIIDDVNVSALNEMIDFEGSVIPDELSNDLDEQMSDSLPPENIDNIDDTIIDNIDDVGIDNIDTTDTINTIDDNPNKQLTEEEIAALFANL